MVSLIWLPITEKKNWKKKKALYSGISQVENNTYTKTMSPLFEYAGIALAIVANPYEYIIASSVLMNFASRSSNSKCTSVWEKNWQYLR